MLTQIALTSGFLFFVLWIPLLMAYEVDPDGAGFGFFTFVIIINFFVMVVSIIAWIWV